MCGSTVTCTAIYCSYTQPFSLVLLSLIWFTETVLWKYDILGASITWHWLQSFSFINLDNKLHQWEVHVLYKTYHLHVLCKDRKFSWNSNWKKVFLCFIVFMLVIVSKLHTVSCTGLLLFITALGRWLQHPFLSFWWCLWQFLHQ